MDYCALCLLVTGVILLLLPTLPVNRCTAISLLSLYFNMRHLITLFALLPTTNVTPHFLLHFFMDLPSV